MIADVGDIWWVGSIIKYLLKKREKKFLLMLRFDHWMKIKYTFCMARERARDGLGIRYSILAPVTYMERKIYYLVINIYYTATKYPFNVHGEKLEFIF